MWVLAADVESLVVFPKGHYSALGEMVGKSAGGVV